MSQALNIVLLSYHNQNGGAGIAAGRLHRALQKEGHHVTYLVQEKSGNDASEVIRTGLWNKLKNWTRFIMERLYFLPNEKSKSIRFLFNPGLFGHDMSQHPAIQKADIIHLHWVNFGFLSIDNIEKLLKLGKPVVWTLHDMWAFTGGCHHSGDCENFQTNCGSCKFITNQNAGTFPTSFGRVKFTRSTTPIYTSSPAAIGYKHVPKKARFLDIEASIPFPMRSTPNSFIPFRRPKKRSNSSRIKTTSYS
jgi:glycosyltransferase involved in cell wall biosynthesis